MKKIPGQNSAKQMQRLPRNSMMPFRIQERGNTGKQSLVLGMVFSIIMTVCSNVSFAQTWLNVGSPGFSAGEAGWLSLAIDGSGTPYVAYQDRANSWKATVMKYNGSSWVSVGSPGFSADTVYFNSTSLAIDGSGTPYVAYPDKANSWKATVKKYNGSSWVTVGSSGFSASSAGRMSLAIDGSGTPYVAFMDGSNGYKATVMKYNGSGWVTVGSAGFSAGETDWLSLALDGSGTPYVAYEDSSLSYSATVKKYNGSSWVTVGSAGFSAGAANYLSLAIGSGTPYLAYADDAVGSKATVMKYNGSSWVAVGSTGFSAGWTSFTSLAIWSGTPYVAYRDGGNGDKATVMKYNGSSWVAVGGLGFSAGEAYYTSLAIGSGTPYVAYQDWGNGYKSTVMKFALGAIVGQPGANVNVSLYPNPTTKGAFVLSAPEAGSLGVYTLEGREVMRSEVKAGTTDITLPSNTTTGVYICRFTGNEGGAVIIRLTYEHE